MGRGAPLPCLPVALTVGQAQVAAYVGQVRSVAWALKVMDAACHAIVEVQALVDPCQAQAAVRLLGEHLSLHPAPHATTSAEVERVAISLPQDDVAPVGAGSGRVWRAARSASATSLAARSR